MSDADNTYKGPTVLQDGTILIRGKIINTEGEFYKVKLVFTPEEDNYNVENAYIINAYTSGKMKKNKIKVLEWDTVDIEISSADKNNLSNRDPKLKGRIIFRYKT